MNNARGAELIARLKAGNRVTVRRADGGTSTGRAIQTATGAWRIRTGPLASEPVTAATIIKVQS